jgi:3-hydroxy-9,10-secoandrosta-1,3,5(10)-triene-9,17-dione monooxygenase reductase component
MVPDDRLGITMMTTELESITATELRRVCAAWPTGVSVVTSLTADDQPVGMAVNSFTSLSLEPPLVLFCPARRSTTYPHVAQHGRFAINVLAAGQCRESAAFAVSGGDKFAGVEWSTQFGLPVLTGVAAVLFCAIYQVHDGGDHEIVIGRVESAVRSDRAPLVFHDGGFTMLDAAADVGAYQ